MDLGEIEGELQRALDGLSTSRAASVAALEKAQAIQNQAAQTGFRRVAEQIGQVREAIRQSLTVQTGVVSCIESTLTSVHSVTADTTPDEIVATLHAAEEKISSGAAAIGRLATNIEGLKSQTAAALQGGQPGPLLGLLNTMQQALRGVVSMLGAAKALTGEAIGRARGLGNSVGVPGTARRPRLPQNQSPTPRPARPTGPHRTKRESSRPSGRSGRSREATPRFAKSKPRKSCSPRTVSYRPARRGCLLTPPTTVS